jgi:hypothetical protein
MAKIEMVQTGSYIPVEIQEFLEEKAGQAYPPISISKLIANILIDWALTQGMKKGSNYEEEEK